jgi:hypothetical protein
MSSLFLPKGLINALRNGTGAVILAGLALLAGCRSASDHAAPGLMPAASAVDLDTHLARASQLRLPILVLVTESGLSQADDHARAVFETATAKGKNSGIEHVLLDVSISRIRAESARFHVTNTPLLLCLTPKGLIVTRDQRPITKELVLDRIAEVVQRAPGLDAKLALLENAAAKNGNDAAAQLELADFLLAQQNARESIPLLASVARSESADTTQRVRAWVELARAHLWIAEPEKGRHEAQELMTVLGPKSMEAYAGCYLALGIQDGSAKRIALARREFQAAMAAAPQSVYAKQAAQALAALPGEAK